MTELKKAIKTETHLSVKNGTTMEVICLDKHIKTANDRIRTPLTLKRLNEIALSLDKVRQELGNADVGQCRQLADYIDLLQNPTDLLNYK